MLPSFSLVFSISSLRLHGPTLDRRNEILHAFSALISPREYECWIYPGYVYSARFSPFVLAEFFSFSSFRVFLFLSLSLFFSQLTFLLVRPVRRGYSLEPRPRSCLESHLHFLSWQEDLWFGGTVIISVCDFFFFLAEILRIF